jgi:LPS-assembly protein
VTQARGLGGRRRKFRNACAASALIAVASAACIAPGSARAGEVAPPQQILLKADEIIYDSNARTVTARGNVEISDEDRTLLADQVTYDEVRDVVTASGNVSLQDSTGNVAYADSVELTRDLREGALSGFAALIGENARLAASSGERRDGRITVANGAVFTPCAICQDEEDRMPLWQIRAERVIHDQLEREFVFEGASFEFFGRQVLYLPYFSQADPTVTHKSGFLLPDVGSSSYLGSFINIPYYFSFGQSRDLTIEPIITTRAGAVLQTEYRQRWDNGGLWLQNTVGFDPGAEGKPGRSEWNSSLMGSGRFQMSKTWRSGFDVQLTSNDTYLQRYELSFLDRFTSNAFAESIRDRNRLSFDGWFFQSVRAADVPGQIPVALPLVEYTHIPEDKILSGRLRVDASALALARDLGNDVVRGSLSADWRAPFTTASGQILTFETLFRSDIYYVSDDGTFGTSPGMKDTQTIGRALGFGMAEWRWPFARQLGMGSDTTLIIEPIAQMIVASSGGNPEGIPNEDSRSFEFDATNLFSAMQTPGLDLWTGGTRSNLGFRATALLPTGSIEATLGQNFRFRSDPNFAPGSGLGDKRSDIVGQIKFQFPPSLVVMQQFNIDPEDGTIRRNEIYLRAALGRATVDLSYVKLPPTAADPSIGEQQQISLNTIIPVFGNWALFGEARRDIAQSEMIESGVGIRYEDECFIIMLGYHRRDTETLNLKPASSVILRLGLKTGFTGGA